MPGLDKYGEKLISKGLEETPKNRFLTLFKRF